MTHKMNARCGAAEAVPFQNRRERRLARRRLHEGGELIEIIAADVADGEVAHAIAAPTTYPERVRRNSGTGTLAGTLVLPEDEYRELMLAKTEYEFRRRRLINVAGAAADKGKRSSLQLGQIEGERHFAFEPWLHVWRSVETTSTGLGLARVATC